MVTIRVAARRERESISAHETTDRAMLRAFLETDRLFAAYALCDLDDREFMRTRWGVATSGGVVGHIGQAPLEPQHDKRAPEFLLKADHWYQIELRTTSDGHAQFVRDGEMIFDFADPAPLTGGWFGFRTVHSRIEIRNFSVSRKD